MQYRKLGKSDLNVPTVIAGAWAMGGWGWGGTDADAGIRAIQAAIDSGMNCIDTAPAYGFGFSEELIGKAVEGRRDGVIIATKCGLNWQTQEGEFFFDSEDAGKPVKIYRNLKRDAIVKECEASLKRLRIDCIDLYQCHWPDASTDLDETMGALLDLQKQGKIRAIGVSNFTPEMMETCLAFGRIDSLQPKYNLLVREIEEEILPFCLRNEIGVITYSSLELGLLTGKVTMERTFPPGDIRGDDSYTPWFKPENRSRVIEALEKIKPIAEAHGITLGQLATAWVIAQPSVTSAIVGVRNPEQSEENAKAGDVALSDDELLTLRTTFETVGPPV